MGRWSLAATARLPIFKSAARSFRSRSSAVSRVERRADLGSRFVHVHAAPRVRVCLWRNGATISAMTSRRQLATHAEARKPSSKPLSTDVWYQTCPELRAKFSSLLHICNLLCYRTTRLAKDPWCTWNFASLSRPHSTYN